MNALVLTIASYKYEIAEYLVNYKGFRDAYVALLPGIYSEKKTEELPEHVHFIEIEQLMKKGARKGAAVKDIPPLDKNFLESALKYESTFICLDSYRFAYPVAPISECKRDFYYYLRYWKNFFETNDIDFVMFDDTPHWHIMFVAYVTAKVLNKQICILSPVGIHTPGQQSGIHIYGDAIENIGSLVIDEYNRLTEHKDENCSLGGVVKEYFENSIQKANEATMSLAKRNANLKQVYAEKFSAPKGGFAELYALKNNIWYYFSAKLKYKSKDRYIDNKFGRTEIRDLKRVRLLHKYDLVALKEYDRKAVYPSGNDKYIFFPLQLWPEATTTPQSGVFAEQYNAIQLLSYILKDYDVKIYVKEYYLQPNREKVFWEEFEGLENVVFIKSDVTSGEMMENALAVANQTGTCLIEAPFYGKPAITFGDGFCLKGMPGLFEISDVEQGKKVIEKILEGVTINIEDLKRYYCAIEKKSVFYHRTSLWEVDKNSDEAALTIQQLKRLLDDVLDENAGKEKI